MTSFKKGTIYLENTRAIISKHAYKGERKKPSRSKTKHLNYRVHVMEYFSAEKTRAHPDFI